MYDGSSQLRRRIGRRIPAAMAFRQPFPASSPVPTSPSRVEPEGRRLYVIGDVHGRADLLRQVHERIEAHLADRPCAEPVEVYLGDLVDRGPDSATVVRALMDRPRSAVVLSGNHERMLLEAIEEDDAVGLWLENGGRQTLRSYGVDASRRALADVPPEAVRSLIAGAIPAAEAAFLRALPHYFVCGGYLFVHAGIRPGVPLASQSLGDVLWIREAFLDHPGDHGLVVVHGHTPVMRPDVRDNRINIDTGAYATGRLTCLVLEGAARAFLDP